MNLRVYKYKFIHIFLSCYITCGIIYIIYAYRQSRSKFANDEQNGLPETLRSSAKISNVNWITKL